MTAAITQSTQLSGVQWLGTDAVNINHFTARLTDAELIEIASQG